MTQAYLDSAYPPNDAALAVAVAAGVRGWSGYFAGPNILNGWSDADFRRVRAHGLAAVAFCSGWSDPRECGARANSLGIACCLDDEAAIRPPGSWAQSWVDFASAGHYGGPSVVLTVSARFYIVAAYPATADPGAQSWPSWLARPSKPCAWQWAGSHVFAGVTVDATWTDDAFGAIMGGVAQLVVGDSGNNDPHGKGAVYRTDWMTKQYIADPGALPGFQASLGAIQTVSQGSLNEVPEVVPRADVAVADLKASVDALTTTVSRIEAGLKGA